MKYAALFVFLLFSGIVIFSAQQKSQYCNNLRSELYEKRQKFLVSMRDKCDSTSGPTCINYVMEVGVRLARFDEEVLKSEGCDE